MRPSLEFALERHRGQEYAGRPFIEHPIAVVQVLERYGVTDDRITDAAYLHDVVEDTDTKLCDIERTFGPEVADIVWRVTDEPGANRKERKTRTYPKIAGRDEAIIVKMADRIANCIQGGKKGNGGKRVMYQAEHEDFCAAVQMQPTSPYYATFQRMMQELNELLTGILPREKADTSISVI